MPQICILELCSSSEVPSWSWGANARGTCLTLVYLLFARKYQGFGCSEATSASWDSPELVLTGLYWSALLNRQQDETCHTTRRGSGGLCLRSLQNHRIIKVG